MMANPIHVAVTIATVCHALAEDDAAVNTSDQHTTLLHEAISPSMLIISGLEIEEVQYIRLFHWRDKQASSTQTQALSAERHF